MGLLKRLDLPPLWIAGGITLAWAQATYASAGLSLWHPVTQLLAGLLVGAGLLVIALGLYELIQQRTTVDPHKDSAKLVQTGIFSRTRNPIYLGDMLVLAGAILWQDAVLSLVLVPIFVWVFERRFIEVEEKRLRRSFRTEFALYERKVGRWF